MLYLRIIFNIELPEDNNYAGYSNTFYNQHYLIGKTTINLCTGYFSMTLVYKIQIFLLTISKTATI